MPTMNFMKSRLSEREDKDMIFSVLYGIEYLLERGSVGWARDVALLLQQWMWAVNDPLYDEAKELYENLLEYIDSGRSGYWDNGDAVHDKLSDMMKAVNEE